MPVFKVNGSVNIWVRGTPKWMVYNGNPKTLLKWMIWGENPPFKETPKKHRFTMANKTAFHLVDFVESCRFFDWLYETEGAWVSSISPGSMIHRVFTWNLKITQLEKEHHLNQTIIFRFHVHPGCPYILAYEIIPTRMSCWYLVTGCPITPI